MKIAYHENYSRHNLKTPAKLPNFAAACDRTGVSSRAAAMIVSAALDDIEEKNTNVIDKKKQREKQKSSKQYMDS